MVPFLWLSQLVHSILRFFMPPRCPDEMRVFSKVKDITNTSSLLSSLKENHHFLDHGLGNILVTEVEYCKCPFNQDSPGEHEFLLVTLKESGGARRMAYLVVDRLNDDTKKYRGDDELRAALTKHQSEEMNGIEETDPNSSSSSSSSESLTTPASAWHTSSRTHRSIAKVKLAIKGDPPDALDRLIILPNKRHIAAQFDILMTMDLTQSQKVTLERFTHLLQTTSRNTPQYHLIFAQCYWYAYTIWRVLEMATQPRVYPHGLAKRQCSHRLTGYGNRLVLGKGKSVNAARSPETVKAQWESEKVTEDEEWAELKRALHAPELAAEERRREAEEGRLQAEDAHRKTEDALRESQARERELQRRLEVFERPNRSANAV